MEELPKENNAMINEISTWEELDMKTELLRGVYANGFEKPSQIQKKAIRPIFDKKDVIAQAQSGTGKTACFVIGTLQIIDISIKRVQAILLSPTRELAIQTKDVLDKLGNVFKDFKTRLLVGGNPVEDDVRAIRENAPHVLVGCPGRVYDMLHRRTINPSTIRILIMDEADEMLSSGFKDQIYDIFRFMPNSIQVGLFSATLPDEMKFITQKFMRTPVEIFIKPEQLTLDGIKQYNILVENDDQKYDTLKDLYESLNVSQSIIFCNTYKRVNTLYDALTQDGFPACQIHSNMDKFERTKNYHDFKNGVHRILISSDVTARGIDVQQVGTVINFDVPSSPSTYLHRIGRSGRWGRKGVGITLVTQRDMISLKNIETFYSIKLNELPLNWAE